VLSGCEPVRVGGIHAAVGGTGPPLLLLHGYPQTHAMWHRLTPALLPQFTVVASDLRGYGDSDKPPPTADHAPYSKRAQAAAQLELMAHLGFERFSIVGHDRGARVAHRLARDRPDAVERLALLDIVPTAHLYANVTRAVAENYFHWFFLTLPHPFPEQLIDADAAYWLDAMLGRFGGGAAVFDEHAVAEYRRCFADPATISATCEDYRAGATIDLEHDAADPRAIDCPLLVLWGRDGRLPRMFDVLETWRASGTDVRGAAIPGGHFLPEESPTETLAELLAFLPAG
jgi:haloacetate dehalogenase